MRVGNKGYVLSELVVALGITVLIAGAAGLAIFHISKSNGIDRMAAARQVENAGDWISHDAQMALIINTANLTPPVFLRLNWTENVASSQPIYHSVDYTIENVTKGIGTLKRRHTSTAGANEQTLIAQYVYFDPSDILVTSNASYQDQVLTVQLTSHVKGVFETREYIIRHRANTVG